MRPLHRATALPCAENELAGRWASEDIRIEIRPPRHKLFDELGDGARAPKSAFNHVAIGSAGGDESKHIVKLDFIRRYSVNLGNANQSLATIAKPHNLEDQIKRACDNAPGGFSRKSTMDRLKLVAHQHECTV